jgi:hypothetical protein
MLSIINNMSNHVKGEVFQSDIAIAKNMSFKMGVEASRTNFTDKLGEGKVFKFTISEAFDGQLDENYVTPEKLELPE